MSQLPKLSGPAGAAFLLSEPAALSTDFDHPEGHVVIRKGAANVTVNLARSYNREGLKSVAWRVIQESFDLLAARRRAALATARGDSECILWSRNGDQYNLICEITIVSKWSMSARGTVGGAGSAPSQHAFIHHNALRFYRMSQRSKDLFDAYRNAYLALECLISDVSPKRRKESELAWLTRVIGGPLAKAVPSGLDARSTIREIYIQGRNPLFHAKTGEFFYPPHDTRREEVQERLQRLTLLLVSLMQYRLGKDVVRRWANLSQSAQDAQIQALFDFDGICFRCGNDSICMRPEIEVVESPRRFGQRWAKVFLKRPKKLSSLRNVMLLCGGKLSIEFELEETVNMSNVKNLVFEINAVSRDLYAPRAFHPE